MKRPKFMRSVGTTPFNSPQGSDSSQSPSSMTTEPPTDKRNTSTEIIDLSGKSNLENVSTRRVDLGDGYSFERGPITFDRGDFGTVYEAISVVKKTRDKEFRINYPIRMLQSLLQAVTILSRNVEMLPKCEDVRGKTYINLANAVTPRIPHKKINLGGIYAIHGEFKERFNMDFISFYKMPKMGETGKKAFAISLSTRYVMPIKLALEILSDEPGGQLRSE